MVRNRKNGLFSGIVSLRSDKDTKNTGAPMGINTHICPERCGKPGVLRAAFTPIQAAPVGCLTGRLYPSFGLPTPAEGTHSVSCWQPIPLSASRPSPRAALPLGAEAGDPTDRNSRRIWLRPYGSGGRRHPPRRDVQRLLLADSTPNRLRSEKIPCDLRSLGPAAPHRLAPTLGGARVSAPDG